MVDKIYKDIKTRIDVSKRKAGANESAEKKHKREAKILQDIISDSATGNSGQGLFLKNVFKDYFSNVALTDKRSMIGSVIRNIKPVPKSDAELKEEKDFEKLMDDYNVLVKEIKEKNEEIKAENEKLKEEYEAKKAEYDSKHSIFNNFGKSLWGNLFGGAKEEKEEKEDNDVAPEEPEYKEEMKIPAAPVQEEVKAVDNFEEKYFEDQAGLLIGGLFKGAGPLLQKILQGIPVNKNTNEYLKKALDDVKSNLLPIPKEIVDAQLLEIINRSNGSITKIEVVNSLGAASVGQAFLCKIHGPGMDEDGREVVVKILRPDVQNRMEREKKILLKCAEKTNAGMRATYLGQLKRIEEELNLGIEADNVRHGQIYNNSTKKNDAYDNVETMKLCSLVEPTADYMVAEKAEGTTVDNYLKVINKKIDSYLNQFMPRDNKGQIINDSRKTKPIYQITDENIAKHFNTVDKISDVINEAIQCQKYLVTLAEKWVTEGLFGEGFYHGDLHAGNIMVSKNKATVIDFGNSTILNEYDKAQITRMMVAATCGDVELFVDGYKNIMSDDIAMRDRFNKQKKNLLRILKPIFDLGDASLAGEKIATALMKAQELGLELPAGIQNFSTCQIRLANTITALNDKIEELRKINDSLVKSFTISYHNHFNVINSVKEGLLESAHTEELYDSPVNSVEDRYDAEKSTVLRNVYLGTKREMINNLNDALDVEENVEENREKFLKRVSVSQFNWDGYDKIQKFAEYVKQTSGLSQDKQIDKVGNRENFHIVHEARKAMISFANVLDRMTMDNPLYLKLQGVSLAIEEFKTNYFKDGRPVMPLRIINQVLKYYKQIVGENTVEQEIRNYWAELDEYRNNSENLTEEQKDEKKAYFDDKKLELYNKMRDKLTLHGDAHGDNSFAELIMGDTFSAAVKASTLEDFNESIKSYYTDKEHGEKLRAAAEDLFEKKESYYDFKKEFDRKSTNNEYSEDELKIAKSSLKKLKTELDQAESLVKKYIGIITLDRMEDIKADIPKISESKRKTEKGLEDFMDVMGKVLPSQVWKSAKRMGLFWTATHFSTLMKISNKK